MAQSVRFVQCAGFRFDSRFWEGPASWTAMRNKDLWQTLEAVLTLCRKEKADFLFLTGDLFEQEYVRKETVERVARSMAKLDGTTRIFIAPGDCDPLVTTTAYRFSEWPGNVHIFPGDISQIEIPSRNVTIYGAGWTTYRQQKAFLKDFPTAEDTTESGQIRLMLLHAGVDSAQYTKGVIPLQQEQIAASGLTYLALGQEERWSGLQQAGETYWADCGQVEARSFQESGPHGVLLGETDGLLTKVEFIELGQRRYLEKILSPQDGNIEALVDKLLASTTVRERQRDLFRLKLTDSWPEIEAVGQRLQQLIKDQFSYVEISGIQGPTADLAVGSRLAAFPALTEVFIQEIEECLAQDRKDEEQKHWQLVRKIGLAALSQGITNNENIIKHRIACPQGEQLGEDEQGIIDWPEGEESDFHRWGTNLRNTGNERISLAQTWNSLARAKKRVEEQAVDMEQVKAEYEALRRDWDAANHRQEEQRLLQIEMKNLLAKKKILAEKIVFISKTQERVALLRQNPDYRELRRIQGELSRFEEICRKTEMELTTYTSDTLVDTTMLENLREECREWALLQEEANFTAAEIQQRTQSIKEKQQSLQTSGYQEFSENEYTLLRQAAEELQAAKEEQARLAYLQDEIASTKKSYNEEFAKLAGFENLAGLTEADQHRITQTANRLAKYQSSKISGFLDQILQEQLGRSIGKERLVSRLNGYFQKYQVADYAEFQQQLKDFQDCKLMVENLQTKLKTLHKKAEREKKLSELVQSRTLLLEQAYNKVNAADFPSWSKGWKAYRLQRSQVAASLNELDLKMEEQQVKEEKLAAYVVQLRDKLKDWVSPVSNLDELLEVVRNVACFLRAKEEAVKEFNALKQTYDTRLGKRNMDQLTRTLEPLADLEREAQLSDEERKAKLAASRQELAETNSRLAKTEKSLQQKRATTVSPDLEKKIEKVKLQWQSYEDLQHALTDTRKLLEVAHRKWHVGYGKTLEAEAQRIIKRIFSTIEEENKDKPSTEAKQVYFAYRLALAQLTLDDDPEASLFFFVGKINEPQVFWENILTYLRELSITRQVSLNTADVKLRKLLENNQGSILLIGSDRQ